MTVIYNDSLVSERNIGVVAERYSAESDGYSFTRIVMGDSKNQTTMLLDKQSTIALAETLLDIAELLEG